MGTFLRDVSTAEGARRSTKQSAVPNVTPQRKKCGTPSPACDSSAAATNAPPGTLLPVHLCCPQVQRLLNQEIDFCATACTELRRNLMNVWKRLVALILRQGTILLSRRFGIAAGFWGQSSHFLSFSSWRRQSTPSGFFNGRTAFDYKSGSHAPNGGTE